MEAERVGRRLNLAHLLYDDGITDIAQESQAAEAGDHLAQEFEPFAAKIGCQDRQASNIATRPRKASRPLQPI